MSELMSADLVTNDLVTEAQRVEEALKDFISTIIQHYRDYDIDQRYLTKFEREISEAETLLDVFSIMKNMYDKLMQNIEKITKNILDCSEVSIEKDPTLKNIINKYEHEIKVHVKVEQELKDVIRSYEQRMKEKDKTLQELQKDIDTQRQEIRVLQKRNSELSLNLHDEIKQKLKIFKRLKGTESMVVSTVQEPHSRANSLSKRKLNSSQTMSRTMSAARVSADVRSPKSGNRKALGLLDGGGPGPFYPGTLETKSPNASQSGLTLFGSKKDKQKRQGSIVLNFEDDLKRFFTGYFTNKQPFISINNSLNKSLGENRRVRDRQNIDRVIRKD